MQKLKNELGSFKVQIGSIYFKLGRVLLRAKKMWSIIIAFLGGTTIIGLGYFCAQTESINFFANGYIEISKWFPSILDNSDQWLSRDFNILAFLYICATAFFFISNLFFMTNRFERGLDIVTCISSIYHKNQEKSFREDLRKELSELKHSPYFILTVGIIFLIGEIIVIVSQQNLTATNQNWSWWYIFYLLVVPIPLNALLVGTQAALIFSIIKTINKIMPPLPIELFDDDSCSGLAPAGTYICFVSFLWLISLILLTPLFILSHQAGTIMFITLAIIGLTFFIYPLYGFHMKLLERKRGLMAEYAKKLNSRLKKYGDNPDPQQIEHINMLRVCYQRAENLKVWVLFSMQSIGLQIFSVFWAMFNTDILNKIKGVLT